MKQYESLMVREDGTTWVATIHRPEALNALNATVLRSLGELITDFESRVQAGNGPRALVLTGGGEKAFVAGADIKSFETMSPSQAAEFAIQGQGLFARFERLTVPVIAAVNGFALGGGLELALACDFIYAAENAKFGLPECTLGLMPGFGGTVRLPRRIGPARAREMTFTGGMVTAQEALQMGLVNKVVPLSDLLATALATAQTVGSRAPVAVGMIKKSIHEGMNLTEAQANSLEARLFGELFGTEDKIEGVRAFIEKRKAHFHGK